MINWMLEVEDVEDVACAVDDMEATDRSLVFGGDEMREGGTRVHGANDGRSMSSLQAAQGCEDHDVSD